MEQDQERSGRSVIGGVDTHKDLHVAAVVDEHDRVLGSRCFATTRHGYKQMLTWMRSFRSLQRVGVEATGTTEWGSFAACSTPASRCSRSQRRTRTIAASAARTMILILRMPRMRLSPAGALSPQEP